jgi:hypothetical protein
MFRLLCGAYPTSKCGNLPTRGSRISDRGRRGSKGYTKSRGLATKIPTSRLSREAHDNAIGYYALLAELRQQVILGALAGLYHRWEKELRDFIERESRYDVQKAKLMKVAWHGPITDIFDLLTQFGWDVRSQPFFPRIDACRPIVNVFKHGKGRSLEDLNRPYPRYLRDPLGPDTSTIPDYLDHTLLTVFEGHFTEIADALRALPAPTVYPTYTKSSTH